MADPPSDHVRRPQQARSRETLARITEAALDLFGEQGVEATTVHQIVERADSSVGSFYARFDGKEALVRFLEERVWTRAVERWERALEQRAWDELSLEELVRSLVASLATLQEADAAQRSALERHARLRGGPDAEEGAFHRRVESGVRRLLLERRDRIRHPDPEVAASVAYRWLLGGLRELLAAGPTAREAESAETPESRELLSRPDRDVVVEELSRGLLAYFGGGQVETEPGDEGVEFFDVWQ